MDCCSSRETSPHSLADHSVPGEGSTYSRESSPPLADEDHLPPLPPSIEDPDLTPQKPLRSRTVGTWRAKDERKRTSPTQSDNADSLPSPTTPSPLGRIKTGPRLTGRMISNWRERPAAPSSSPTPDKPSPSVGIAALPPSPPSDLPAAPLLPPKPSDLPAARVRFAPMDCITGVIRNMPHWDVAWRAEHGVSPNYKGNVSRKTVSINLSPSESTALWLERVPENVSVSEIFAAIAVHKPGRVMSVNIVWSEDRSHRMPAVSVVMFTRAGAERLYNVAWSPPSKAAMVSSWREAVPASPSSSSYLPVAGPGLFIRSSRVKVTWNRNLSRPFPTIPGSGTVHSRVVCVDGPRHIVNRASLEKIFNENFFFKTEKVEESFILGKGMMVWHFARYNPQASSAMKILQGEEFEEAGVRVSFGADPCADPNMLDQ
ncbi:hypothetical protein B0H63DRAFT_519234 [Podospora didyma]|uniref:Uncharacterized protein n=1 Tax=Podospora didyma TaxID=330526 RepID=A0AAE0NYZ7_9PEZI|nr:hypothetical protein B0H63DRAFT_519234 [Podospora didyma]